MSYDDIESHKKAKLLPLSRKGSFGKTTSGVVKLIPSLFRINTKNETQARGFSLNFAKFLRPLILQMTSRPLIL